MVSYILIVHFFLSYFLISRTSEAILQKLTPTFLLFTSSSDLGKYGSKEGQCETCPTGYFQDTKGEPSCQECPVDTYLSEEGKSSYADCVKCSDDRSTGVLASNTKASACLCKRGVYYSNGTDCVACPEGADCGAGDGLTIEDLRSTPGFWRADNGTDLFVDCRTAYKTGDVDALAKKYCVGGNSVKGGNVSSAACLEGSSGPLCGVCVEDYVKIGDDCKPCPGGAKYLAPVMALLGSCVAVFLVTLIMICTTHGHKEENVSAFMTEIKIIVSWLQILSVVAQTFDSVKWPSGFTSASQSMNVVNLDLSFFLSSAGACTMAIPFMGKFAVSAASPIGFILSVKLAQIVGMTLSRGKKIKKKSEKKEKNEKKKSSQERLHPDVEKPQAQKSTADKMIITLLLLLYPSIANQAFTMFRCRPVGGLGDIKILEKDYSVECNVGAHGQYIFVAIAAIVVYALGVPIMLLYLLWSNQSHLHDPTHIKHHREVRSRLGGFFLQCE